MKTIAQGIIRKMRTRLEQPVSYGARFGDEEVPLNPFLEKEIKLHYSGNIFCVHCGRKSSKSFNQGYCYPCFQSLAQCDSCIIHPERCHFEQGSCREPAWGEKYCMQDHIVYLANSSGLKVGITRATQVPTRWIDQGATQALAVMRVRSRLQSGVLEVMFKQHVADKTNWRDMLKGAAVELDMAAERDRLLAACQGAISELEDQFGFFAISKLSGIEPVSIEYPVAQYPEKISSFNFDKDPEVSGKLLGIKGQYLILDGGVINLRRFSGYEVELSA
ncbi:MAG TPA: DUF2797 domain-containing protein [Gammaproteobacteria bacterium]|nr:MAG: DUF2797 domain-containing protein [Gammaproteobacteria bacterium TMED163]HAR90604.1 DUF2797 domain-containing protein [Gammaproteobacteria bacterium]HAU24128.1 DUF2797 domain-containing protein [Gammaproteobacteria bacterium]HCI87595.1 DUF2797 domain-containing protein [Gammaproteobacteria bacterium]|tara:strand:- start:2097 stop:2924 length:828 start_codon:yes stop_codon:yes gene_type:complete